MLVRWVVDMERVGILQQLDPYIAGDPTLDWFDVHR